MNSVNISSNRSFGIVFFIFFIILAFYPLINNGEMRISFLLISIIFLVLGLINSKILSPLNKLWYKFGILLGKIFSPIIMGIIFYLVVTPIGLIMRLIGKDVLNLKYQKKKTYWIEKDGIKSKMKNQF
tara:strand:- start:473 stop:856 length:384 start_codon:yes stop_codon:yes gene_type:complete